MSTTEILCCGAGQWAILIGITEIVYGVVSVILTPLGYWTFWFLNSDDKNSGTIAVPMIVAVNFIIIGLLLLLGTLKEKICYLRTCFIVKIILFVIFTISEIVEVKSKGPVTVVDGLITLAIPCFVIWAVRVRIRDLEYTEESQPQCNNSQRRQPICTCDRRNMVV